MAPYQLLNDAAAQVSWKPVIIAGGFSFAAGFVDGNTNVRFQAFGGMMTGNAAYLGISIASGPTLKSCLYIALLASFALGAVIASEVLKRHSVSKARGMMGLLMFVLLIATDALDEVVIRSSVRQAYRRFAVLFSAVAMGVQNVSSMKEKALQQNTTIFTGNLQKLSEVFHRVLRGETKHEDPQLGVQLGLSLLIYIFGATVGVLAIDVLGPWSLWPAAAIQLCALVGLAAI
uniref:DUF1275 domain-containing protein n=1 Tax=Zooxanthella nutricula TaxID=1333877 RepID=A0A6V0E9Z8_9DINO|mmetsp:Transcript_22190/g.66402  ORF Transcript_22190/g.66402 Transcript_22190/m.66402 type:complete len:232 (+) Transcript_22190:52-747(+)